MRKNLRGSSVSERRKRTPPVRRVLTLPYAPKFRKLQMVIFLRLKGAYQNGGAA